MANAKIIITAAYFLEAMAAENPDFKALLEQAVKYAGELEVKVAALDELNEKITSLTNEQLLANQRHEADLATITQLNEKVESLGDSQEKLDELQSQITELETERDEALKEIVSLSEKLDLQEKTKDLPGILVEVRGEPLMLIVKNMIVKGVRMTAEEISKDQELLESMYDKKSGALVSADQLTQVITD